MISANTMACEDPEAGFSSVLVRGRGGPKFHDTKDASRSLLVRDQVVGADDEQRRFGGTFARHGAPLRDV